MIVLKLNKLYLVSIGLCTPEINVKWKTNAVYMMTGSLLFVVALFGSISGTMFVVRSASTDLEQSIFAMYAASGYISVSYVLIAGYFLRHRITKIFSMIQRIYDECKREFDRVKALSLVNCIHFNPQIKPKM